ncbi:MAG: membrane protein insertion efficiency factor YidD [Epulopiscium sp. Nele67-Bin005]|nr:MAG: membrane protein insertion efficiency factor YidD [Epulopiscium sp. Nele67-Bin005]
MHIFKKFALNLIKFYQQCISPILGPRCRFIPTCSQYTYEAILIHGILKGVFLGAKRILKCNPLFKPQYDPVPPKKSK